MTENAIIEELYGNYMEITCLHLWKLHVQIHRNYMSKLMEIICPNYMEIICLNYMEIICPN